MLGLGVQVSRFHRCSLRGDSRDPTVAAHSCRSCRTLTRWSMSRLWFTCLLRLFMAVCTGTRPGLTPTIRAGKGWRGRRELVPRRSATQLGACLCGHIDKDMSVTHRSAPPPPQPPQQPPHTTTTTATTATTTTTTTTTTTPWPFWLKVAHAQIEKCISLMVKSLGKFLLGRRVRRNRGVPPAPVVEYIAPAPVVSPEGIFFAPAPAVYAAPAPVDEYIAPAPAVYVAPAPVVEYIAPAPAVYAAPSCRVRGTCTCGGVHRARSGFVRCTCTCGRVHRARSCRVRRICTCGQVHYAGTSSVRRTCAFFGVHCARSCRVRGTSASGGAFTRASCDPSAYSSCGVHHTRALRVSRANASCGVCCTVSRASVPSLSGCIGHVFA